MCLLDKNEIFLYILFMIFSILLYSLQLNKRLIRSTTSFKYSDSSSALSKANTFLSIDFFTILSNSCLISGLILSFLSKKPLSISNPCSKYPFSLKYS